MSDKVKFAQRFNAIEMFRYCEQCGRCSSACPITGVNGFNIRRLIRHVELDLIDEIADTPMPWFCATCGRCEDACPNGIKILDITRTLRAEGPRERIPATPLCIQACPAGIDIPGYLRFIARGEMDEACKLIIERAPFPGILGRVCTHPCETACKRGEVNASISICAAKRHAADKAGDYSAWMSATAKDTDRKVAVIGAGPAGLTAAFYLRKKGHQVTVLEARSKPGGMMRYGIPFYRLPGDILDKEIDLVLGTGIELKTDQKLGVDYEIEQLKQDGFEAVFIAVGAQLSRRIELDGVDLPDVQWGVEFLAAVAEGRDVAVKDNLVVVGGGNVAVDVALTAVRLGADNVTLACLESLAEMPANPWEVEQAREEGVAVLDSWGPDKIIENDGNVAGLELVRCASVFDDEGNFCPYFDDTRKSVEADQIILAIGQASETAFCRDFCFLDDQGSLPVDRGLIAIDKDDQQTAMAGVFAGGDAANGPATVIEAIAAGRRAAVSIDRYLGGDGEIELGMRNAECGSEGMGSMECGKGNAECGSEGMGSMECGKGNAECGSEGMGSMECGKGNAECGSEGMGSMECGKGNAECGSEGMGSMECGKGNAECGSEGMGSMECGKGNAECGSEGMGSMECGKGNAECGSEGMGSMECGKGNAECGSEGMGSMECGKGNAECGSEGMGSMECGKGNAECGSEGMGSMGCGKGNAECGSEGMGSMECGKGNAECGSEGMGSMECGKGNAECGSEGMGSMECGKGNAECGSEGMGSMECGKGNAECGSEGMGSMECGKGNAAFDKLRRGKGGKQNAEHDNEQLYSGGREFGFAELKRVEMPSLPVAERTGGFDEVELGFSDEQAKAETHRCLQCDLEICLANSKFF